MSWAIRAKALLRVRGRSTGTTAPSLSEMIGLTLSILPSSALAPPMRPPRLTYSSVSSTARIVYAQVHPAHEP